MIRCRNSECRSGPDRARSALCGQLGDAKVGVRFRVEDRIGRGGARLSTNPGLDGIEALGGLMDVVEFGDVAEGVEQFDQTRGAVVNRFGGHIAVRHNLGVVTLPREFTVHGSPQSPDNYTVFVQAYSIGFDLQTTNMQFDEDLHNIFGIYAVEE